jgi:hypothetical protein
MLRHSLVLHHGPALAFVAVALLAASPLAQAAQTSPPAAVSAPAASAQAAPASASAAMKAAAPAILDDDPSALLGLSLGESFTRFGPPSSVRALRGDESWQDDVAFVYASGYTLFMYGDRIWQLRLTKPYAGSIFGLFLGDGADKVLSILGQPYENGPGYMIYRMPYKSYPVRLRLALQDERIVDAYLFRADF